MATEVAGERLQAPTSRDDSAQRGCTPWLLISCIVLTFTTAFVFGWGLGAPNMYNSYTEPFLKGLNPCQAEQAASAQTNQAINDAEPAASQRLLVKRQSDDAADDDGVDDSTTISIADTTSAPGNTKASFNFFTELKNGIPQTIFLIGAFLGALTGPMWGQYFHRKQTVFANYIFCFASSLAILLSYYKGYRFLFYVSRFLLGYQGNDQRFSNGTS